MARGRRKEMGFTPHLTKCRMQSAECRMKKDNENFSGKLLFGMIINFIEHCLETEPGIVCRILSSTFALVVCGQKPRRVGPYRLHHSLKAFFHFWRGTRPEPDHISDL